MTIDGKIESYHKARTRDGSNYVMIQTKGRKFITFNETLMVQLASLLGVYASIDYQFFKDNRFPNVYKLIRVMIR